MDTNGQHCYTDYVFPRREAVHVHGASLAPMNRARKAEKEGDD